VRSPWWAWAAAAVVLLPALVPFAALVARVGAAGTRSLEIALSGRTAELIWNTTQMVVVVTASAAVIGVGAAWLTERTDLPGRRFFRVTAALPLVIPSYVIALTLLSAFGSGGILADATGISIPAPTGLAGAWIALTLSTYPFVYLTSAAALRRLDPALEEAARGLGSPPSKVFWTIVVPQLRPALAGGLLLVSLYSLSDFGAVSLVRFDSFTRVVYAQYAGRLDRTPAAVLAMVLVLLALVVLWAEARTRGRAAYHGRTSPRPMRRMTLGPWARSVGVASLTLLALLSLVLPVGTLIAWMSRGSGTAFEWGAASGSLVGSALAAVLAVAVALPTGLLVTRYASRRTRWVETASYAVFALPHITVGLAVVFFASRYLGGLYQSLTLLVLVYASIFFAQALGPVRASMLQVSPSLEEASRSLGAGRIRTMLRVTAPLVRRGLLAGGLLVFLTTMKELPATLLLRPTEFDTLAIRIWSASNELLYARAAGPALLLLAVSALPMYLLATRER
jgi:iron(III) transport system permease protein